MVVEVGRLTRDIDVSYTKSGSAIGNMSIAVNRRVKNGEQWVDEANYFDVSLFGKIVESLKPYLTKGKQVVVKGYLKQDRWEKDGQKFSKIKIVADDIELCSSGQQGGGQAPRGNTQQSAPSEPDYPGFQEDIPF